jgi:hypothetical protein
MKTDYTNLLLAYFPGPYVTSQTCCSLPATQPGENVAGLRCLRVSRTEIDLTAKVARGDSIRHKMRGVL